MTKFFFLCLLLPLPAMAMSIPIEKFDQSKLENLIRKIPSAFQESREENGIVKKTYSFPSEGPLRIYCEADYFQGAQAPTYKACNASITVGKSGGISANKSGDEFKVRITDVNLVKELYKAIAFSPALKELYSHERVYGQAFDGTFRNLFRYYFSCTSKLCEVTMTSKPAQE